MSANEMRRAAESLRQLARAATPGRWGVGNGYEIATEVEQRSRGSFSYEHMIARLDDSDYDEDWAEPRDNGATEEDDASYIVTMQPVVGLALADWLHRMAEAVEHGGGNARLMHEALAVARLINGGAA